MTVSAPKYSTNVIDSIMFMVDQAAEFGHTSFYSELPIVILPRDVYDQLIDCYTEHCEKEVP